MRFIKLYVDGSITSNPGGCGGWAWHAYWPDGREMQNSGAVPNTTNNRMELRAALEGLRAILPYVKLDEWGDPSLSIMLFTDSMYVYNIITGQNRAHVNLDLVVPLIQTFRYTTPVWIKGHRDLLHNIVDEEARRQAFRLKEELYERN